MSTKSLDERMDAVEARLDVLEAKQVTPPAVDDDSQLKMEVDALNKEVFAQKAQGPLAEAAPVAVVDDATTVADSSGEVA